MKKSSFDKKVPFSGSKKFEFSITYSAWDEDSLEMGETDDKGYEIEPTIEDISEILHIANSDYGIYYPMSVGYWEATEPKEDMDYFTKGIKKYYVLHVRNEDGTEISEDENDFMTHLLSDGRYNRESFPEFLFGGWLKGGSSYNHSWHFDHNRHNKSEDYEVPVSKRKRGMGGDAESERDYLDNRIYNLKNLLSVINDEDAPELQKQIERLERERDALPTYADGGGMEWNYWKIDKNDETIYERTNVASPNIPNAKKISKEEYDANVNKEYADGGEILKKTIVYDNDGETLDRYTVFTPDGSVYGMSETGGGFNQYLGEDTEIEKGKHLGRKLKSVPKSIEKAVLDRMENNYARGGGVKGKSNLRVRNSPAIKYANFEDGSNINLVRLNPYKIRGGKPYKDNFKYGIMFKNESLLFEDLDSAESYFDHMVKERKNEMNLLEVNKTNNYADGGDVVTDISQIPSDSKIRIDHISVDVYEDSYEEGEGEHYDTYTFDADNDSVPVNSLVEYLSNLLGVSDNPKDYSIMDSVVHYSQLVDKDYNRPSNSEKEQWKRGDLKLYSANYTIHVTLIDEIETSDEIISRLTGIDVYKDGGTVKSKKNKSVDYFDFDRKMALINLDMIFEYAKAIDEIVTEKTKLEDWVKMKLTIIEQNMKDVKHSLEGWEKFSKYGSGGMIVKKQMLHVAKYSKDLMNDLKKGSKLMSWQEAKLSITAEYIDAVYHYLDYEMGSRAVNVKKAFGGTVDDRLYIDNRIANMKRLLSMANDSQKESIRRTISDLEAERDALPTMKHGGGVSNKKYSKGGLTGKSAKVDYLEEEFASQDLLDQIKKKLRTSKNDVKDKNVIAFAYTDYGGDFFDKVAIEYFKENYPKNIVWENSGYGGQNAFVFGEPAKEYMEQTEDYPLGFEDIESYYYEKQNEQENEDFEYFLNDLKGDDYSFDFDEVLSWLNENRGGYYSMTTQGLDFSYSDLTEELVNEGLIRKHDDEEYAGGGGVDIIHIGDKIRTNWGETFYVVNDYGDDWYWVTKNEEDRYNSNALGYTLRKSDISEVIEDNSKWMDGDNYASGGGVKEKDDNYHYIVRMIENNEKSLKKNMNTEKAEETQREIQRLKDKLKHEYGKTYAGGGEAGKYEDWEMIVVSKELNKDGGRHFKDRFLVSARNIDEAKEIATKLWNETFNEDSDLTIVKVMSESLYRLKYMDKYEGGGGVDKLKVGDYVSHSKGKSKNYGTITQINDKMAVVDFEEKGNTEVISIYDLKKTKSKKYEEGGEAGEMEDWMNDAIKDLRSYTDNDDLKIENAYDDDYFVASDGSHEYLVFEDFDEAHEYAVDDVKNNLEENPEYFQRDWLMAHLEAGNFFRNVYDEWNMGYATDIMTEDDDKYPNRLIAEMVQWGIMDSDEANGMDAEEIANDRIGDYVNALTDDQINQGNDGFDYYIDNFGEEEAFNMAVKNNLFDIENASEDAVNIDGVAHFISSYDGEEIQLDNGSYAYRIN